jgi:hypothetical protein
LWPELPQNSRHRYCRARQNQEILPSLNAANALQSCGVNGAKPESRCGDQFRFERPVRAQELDLVGGTRPFPAYTQFLRHGQGRENVPTGSARDHEDPRSRRGAVLIHDILDIGTKSKSKVKTADDALGRPSLFTFAFLFRTSQLCDARS